MFSENTLMMYQQDLQLGPYFVKWHLAIYIEGFPDFPLIVLKINYSCPNS